MTAGELLAWLESRACRWRHVPELATGTRVAVERTLPSGRILTQQYVYEPTLLGHRWRIEQRKTRKADA